MEFRPKAGAVLKGNSGGMTVIQFAGWSFGTTPNYGLVIRSGTLFFTGGPGCGHSLPCGYNEPDGYVIENGVRIR